MTVSDYRVAASFKCIGYHKTDLYLTCYVNGELKIARNFQNELGECAQCAAAIFSMVEDGSIENVREGLDAIRCWFTIGDTAVQCDPDDIPEPSDMDVMIVNMNPDEPNFLHKTRWKFGQKFYGFMKREYDRFVKEIRKGAA